MLTPNQINRFRAVVDDYYIHHGRDLPWRQTQDPYAILVSEVMLQQTQVPRVVEKYQAWMQRFPTVTDLANSSLSEVLRYWSGLGYNRRALYLLKLANTVLNTFNGVFPTEQKLLCSLPGVGSYTAKAVGVFAYNQPLPLIETNVRTVYIHHFFNQERVTDSEILPLVEETLDADNPRRWFNALMDYGSWLKSQAENPSRKSATYSKQSPLKGSVREVRGWVLKQLLERNVSQTEVSKQFDQERIDKALKGLIKEGVITETKGFYQIKTIPGGENDQRR